LAEPAQPGEAVQHDSPYLSLGDPTFEVACHDVFAQQLETAHLGFNKAMPVVAAPSLPDCPSQPFCSSQDVVTCIGTRLFAFQGLAFFRVGMMTCAMRNAMPS
jgi:hypothetical protein